MHSTTVNGLKALRNLQREKVASALTSYKVPQHVKHQIFYSAMQMPVYSSLLHELVIEAAKPTQWMLNTAATSMFCLPLQEAQQVKLEHLLALRPETRFLVHEARLPHSLSLYDLLTLHKTRNPRYSRVLHHTAFLQPIFQRL